MTWKYFVDHWKEISSGTATVAAGAGYLWRKFFRYCYAETRKRWALLGRLPELIGENDGMKAEIQQLQQTANEIMKQLRPNGGTSIFDIIARLEHSMFDFRQFRWALEDLSGSASWQSDEKGAAVYISSAMADLMGLDEKELLRFGWVSAIHVDDRQRVFQEWQAAVSQGRRFDETYRAVRPDRTTVLVNARALPMRDRQDRVTGYVGIVQVVQATGH